MSPKLRRHRQGSPPYLTVVATARNDDHGGNPLYRMQLFVNGLISQCDRFKLPAELVLVEWNPPADRPRLAEVIEWPAGNGYCAVRIVEVPYELHSRLAYSDRLPLFQMIGKNVGIRRARGEFVVATNIDILFSNEVMRFVADRRLKHGFVYRVDRFDVPAEIDREWPMRKQLEWCKRAAIRINRREGTLDLRNGTFYRIYADFTFLTWLRTSPTGVRLTQSIVGGVLGLRRLATVHAVPHHGISGRVSDALVTSRLWTSRARRSIGAFFATTRFVFRRIYAFAYWFGAGFNSPRAVPGRVRRRLGMMRTAAASPNVRPRLTGFGAASRRTFVLIHIPVALVRACAQLVRRKAPSLRSTWDWERSRIRLHTNASGDFTLMSAADWLRTKGYAEFEMYSMHIDGLLLYSAHYCGIYERFLPFPVYHIEHGGGFRPEATDVESLESELNQREIPQITNDELVSYIVEMYMENAPLEVNRDDWGLADSQLPETTPLPCPEASATQVGAGR